MFCAVCKSKPASVTPARLLSLPNVTMPVIVNVCARSGRFINTLSPIAKWCLVAVALSITTSSAEVGALPSTSR